MSSLTEPRHEFYETDEKVTISIFDKGAVSGEVSVHFSSQSLTYQHGDKRLVLDPLTGEIDPDGSDFTVGKVKVEIRLMKKSQGRWTKLVGESMNDQPTVDPSAFATTFSDPAIASRAKPKKNWEGIAEEAIKSEPERTTSDDPNAGGDAALNGFFQKLFADADEDTKRAMMKSYQESGGTSLSTNWAEVGKQKMEVKPPEGSEWKKWG